jgi:hypothetical protein
MSDFTRRMWAKQDQHHGDRLRLFTALGTAFEISTVLYPGSFVDIAPSFVFDDVTYVDTDRRAARFFADTLGVNVIITEQRTFDTLTNWRSINADYTTALEIPTDYYDLLVSLYAGFVSEHCTRYLRPGGFLLANPSHGDAAMASINPAYRLVGAIEARSGGYTVRRDNLDSYMQPKRPTLITTDLLHQTGRGIAYTKPAFAYLFQRN